MRVNANAVLRSWTLLAAFGGSYAPDTMHVAIASRYMYIYIYSLVPKWPGNEGSYM